MLDQYLGPGFISIALALATFAFTLNRKDAKEAVETAGMNIDRAMARAAEAEAREAEARARLKEAEAEIARLRILVIQGGGQP